MIASPKQWTSTDWRKYCAESSAARSLYRARFAGAVAARGRDPECAAVRISRQRAVGRTPHTSRLHATRFGEKRQRRLGVLDAAAIEKVKTEAWPEATNADELHDALMLIGVMTPEEIRERASENAEQFFSTLVAENRATA
jgi:hypothetical protein